MSEQGKNELDFDAPCGHPTAQDAGYGKIEGDEIVRVYICSMCTDAGTDGYQARVEQKGMSHIHVEHDATHELHDYFTDDFGNIHHKASQGWKATTPEFPNLVVYGDSPEKARANMEWRIRVEVMKQEFMWDG